MKLVQCGRGMDMDMVTGRAMDMVNLAGRVISMDRAAVPTTVKGKDPDTVKSMDRAPGIASCNT